MIFPTKDIRYGSMNTYEAKKKIVCSGHPNMQWLYVLFTSAYSFLPRCRRTEIVRNFYAFSASFRSLKHKLTLLPFKIVIDILQSDNGVQVPINYFIVEHYQMIFKKTLTDHL